MTWTSLHFKHHWKFINDFPYPYTIHKVWREQVCTVCERRRRRLVNNG